jgi:receptor protein-tyrosine kinase
MSLVEQAAERLAQLRKSGREVSGELSQVVHDPAAAPASADSTIERAARKLDQVKAPGQENRHAPASPLPINDSFAEWPQDARREPHFTQFADAPEVSVERPAARVSRTVQVDLEALAAQGFLVPNQTDGPLANELRLIKRPLINQCRAKGTAVQRANRIMVTSALPGEGKSFLALNLAISVALERDSTVLLIDADTTRPSLSRLLGVPPMRGLLDLLTNRDLDPTQVLLRTSIDRLSFLPAGTLTPNATELLASRAMEELAAHMAARYSDRVLIIDTPPLLSAPEPPVLAGHMGQIVVVVEAGKTTHRCAQQALTAVQACPLVMTVLNKASGSRDGYYVAGR